MVRGPRGLRVAWRRSYCERSVRARRLSSSCRWHELEPSQGRGLRSLIACRSASMASLSLSCRSRVVSTVLCRSILLSSVRSRSMFRSSVLCRSAFLSSARCSSIVRSRLLCTSLGEALVLPAGCGRLRETPPPALCGPMRCSRPHSHARPGTALGTPATPLAWPSARPASPPGSARSGVRGRLAAPDSPRTARSALLCCPHSG